MENKNSLLFQILQKLNLGLTTSEIFEYIYLSFRPLIPYNRIGIALLDSDKKTLTSFWTKSDLPTIKLPIGYSAKMECSSLQTILETNKPRILNDLEKYLKSKPSSESTRLIIEEGIKSSLTCPLITSNGEIGFIFFSSITTNTYEKLHVDLFEQIANVVSTIIEKAQLSEKLSELNTLKTKFIGMAAHDLKNPLQVILANIDTLMLEQITSNQKESFITIKSQIAKMLNLIKNFLDVSVIESGHLTLKKQPIELQSFLRSALETNHYFADQKKITLHLDASPLSLSFDPDRINQVVTNLLTNAIKFSPPNSKITITTEQFPTHISISISDEGPGVASNINLFEFYQKGSSPESSTGLGLAISKKIIEAHLGTLTYQNNPEKGATFTFTLPL